MIRGYEEKRMYTVWTINAPDTAAGKACLDITNISQADMLTTIERNFLLSV